MDSKQTANAVVETFATVSQLTNAKLMRFLANVIRNAVVHQSVAASFKFCGLKTLSDGILIGRAGASIYDFGRN